MLLSLLSLQVYSQTADLTGKIIDSKSKKPIIGAHVKITHRRDTTQTHIMPSDTNGNFLFSNIRFGGYSLDVSSIGYAKFTKFVRVTETSVNAGELELTETEIPVDEMVVEEMAPRTFQKGDTTEFNARAFKLNKDAVAEDLVQKMPGVTVEQGTVKAHGEEVKRVIVDGKQFFGDDPTLALRNLPAEVVDKIQIFDKQSDQAQFTGFDDGQAVKTMNVVTRPERRIGTFGKAYAGIGDAGKYIGGGNLNHFQQGTRISILGLSNNINQQNFSQQDLVGVMGGGGGGRGGGGGGGGMGGMRFERGGGGGGGGGQFQGGFGGSNFLVGQQNGIASTNSFGVNYSDNWGEKLSVQHSYFFNRTQNNNLQNLQRQYFTSSDSTRTYDQFSDAETKNFNHRLEMRFEYTIDTMNSLILQPRLFFQDNNSSSYLFGSTMLNDSLLINNTITDNNSNTTGNNLSNQLTFRHRFETTGRTFSIELRNSFNNREGTGNNTSDVTYYHNNGNLKPIINQHTTTKTDGSSISSRIVYTEPIAENTQLQISYNPSFSKSNADYRRFNLDSSTYSYSQLDTTLSNQYENTYTTQNAGVAYRWRDSSINLNLEMSYQISDLEGGQVFPFTSSTKKIFYNLLPSAFMQYKISETKNLHTYYRTSTREPSINQLQNVVDNSNPLLLTSGNPDLKPSLTHTLMSRYSLTSIDRTKSTFLMFMTSLTNNYIGNSTITNASDLLVPTGVQRTTPVNLDNSWNARTFITHGIPFEVIKSNLNMNAGYTFSQTPGLINNVENITSTSGINAGVVVSSNISEDLDYTLSYSGNYNISRNSLQEELDNNYYYHNSGLKFNATFWESLVLRNELTNMLYSGLGDAYNQNYWLWNLSLGKKIFDNQNGEIRLTITDLLNQNTSVNRSVTETYVEDSNNQVLGRYLLLMFTYTLR